MDEHNIKKNTGLRCRPYIGYWITSGILLILGSNILLTQIISHNNPAAWNDRGSYSEFVGGLWRGDEGLDFHGETLSYNLFLIYSLIMPYVLLISGAWLGIVGYRRRKLSRDVAHCSKQNGDCSSSEIDPDTVWPPPI